MSTATTKPHMMIASDRTVARLMQFFAFAVAGVIFPMCVVATTKFATSPFEVFVGLVLGGILAVAIVIMGMLVPSAMLPRSF